MGPCFAAFIFQLLQMFLFSRAKSALTSGITTSFVVGLVLISPFLSNSSQVLLVMFCSRFKDQFCHILLFQPLKTFRLDALNQHQLLGGRWTSDNRSGVAGTLHRVSRNVDPTDGSVAPWIAVGDVAVRQKANIYIYIY